ncbi:TetR/AcrR family transcriptional regulator [Novosphingobium rosa]|uniref:TetR/AcrR family transcriptional regulator n=1 Tax=Novosphingobium rosa TaxID=76978 RepID=UPI00082FD791|nr:TetR/AcrR family transcriptional regulator [Novosphingobium rosa]
MTIDKTKTVKSRGEPVRQGIIDAAERLLRQGKAEFSMRDLAAEAQVSFATPFNHFGSKAAIMQALSARRIDEMQARYLAARPDGDAHARVLAAIAIAAGVMLEEARVNRVVMGWLGTPVTVPGPLEQSSALWALALGDGDGLSADRAQQLPRQLAFGFRGVLSFWTAGELPDEELAPQAQAVAATVLRGFA